MNVNNLNVFISYARKDAQYGKKVEEFLRSKNIPTWMDNRNLDPSGDFTGEIEQAISVASHMLVCLSSDVKRSDSFVRREIVYALAQDQNRVKQTPQKRLPIIPVLFPEGEMPVIISTLTYIPILKETDYEQGFAEILNRLQAVSEIKQEPIYKQPEELIFYLNELHQWTSDRLKESVYVLLQPKAEGGIRFKLKNLFKFNISLAIRNPVFSDENEQNAPIISGQLYDSFPKAFEACQRRVILLGEPGAGKTTSLLMMARDAAVARLSDPTSPIPILASIYNWNFKMEIPKWAREQTGRRIIQESSGQSFIYLLDALDELAPESVDETISQQPINIFFEALNREIPKGTPLVVSCRTENFLSVYKDRENPLPLIQLKDLTDEQIKEFLVARGQEKLWYTLQSDEELIKLMRTPLLLSIFSYAFEKSDLDYKQLERLTEATLFDVYVKRRFIHESGKSIYLDYPEDKTRNRLSKLAIAMRAETYLIRSISRERFNELFGEDADQFLSFAKRMYFLQTDRKGAIQFVHFYLQAFFAALSLIECFENEAYEENSQTIQFAANLHSFAEPVLLYGVAHKSDNVRLSTINALGLIKDNKPPTSEVIDKFSEIALKDKNYKIREFAIKGFIELSNNRAFYKGREMVTPTLTKALRDKYSEVRFAAAKALTIYYTQEIVPELLNLLEKEDLNYIMREIVTTLGKIGDPRAVPYLLKFIHRRNITYLKGVPVRDWTKLLLATILIKPASKISPFIVPDDMDSLNISAGLRQKSIWALGEIGQKSPEISNALIELLQKDDKYPKEAAIEALGKLADSTAISHLISLLTSNDFKLRILSVSALGNIGDVTAINPILQMLSDISNLEEDAKEHWMGNEKKNVYPWILDSLCNKFGADKVLKHGDVNILINLLNHDNSLIRVDTVETLGVLGARTDSQFHVRDQVIVPALSKCLDDEDGYVVSHAERSLDRILARNSHSI